MTISSEIVKNVYVGDTSTLVFAYTYKIFEDTDVEVTIQDTSVDPQTEITLVLNSDYTVSGVDNPTGGDITLLLGSQLSVAPIATDNITIRSNLPITQETDYVENDPFPAESHEEALDRETRVSQQLAEEIGRSLKLPANITGIDVTLPPPEADAPIGWNSTGTGLTNNPTNTNLSQIDSLANPDFIGATGGDGVIRVSGLLSYIDGGDFVTIGITDAAIDHDALTNYVALEHYPAIDEDNMVSDSDTQVPTQQSVKAYVDASVALVNEFVELTDTPASYAGAGLQIVRVNATPDALEFVTLNAALVPITDSGALITATDVEGALAENRALIDTNTSKVSNATHTVDVTGSGALTLAPVAITNKPAATVASGDLVVIADIDSANALSQVTAQSIADLGAGGGPIEIFDEGGSLTATASSIDFVGAGVVATNVGSAVTVTIGGGGGGSGESMETAVNQTTHGFSVGNVLYHNGTIYALADASADATAEVIGIVSAVAGVDDFTITTGGRITGLSGLTVGEAHFLSETAGAITATQPVTSGAISKPILVADSATTAYIFNMRGSVIGSGAEGVGTYTQTFVNADLTAGSIAISHNLNDQHPLVQVYDDSDNLILPDEITATSVNVSTIDLTGYGDIGATPYTVVISGTGASATNPSFVLPFVDADLDGSDVLTVAHGLGQQYVQVQIFNNSDELIQPTDVTLTDANNLDVDLAGFGVLTGTWRAVVISAGGAVSSTATDLSLAGQVAEDFAVFDGTNWLPKGGVELIFNGNTTRDLSIATGTQAVTGVGFKPKYVMITAGGGALAGMTSWGSYNGSINSATYNNDNTVAKTFGGTVTKCVQLNAGGGNTYTATISSFDVDGFTLSWVRTGTPTGTTGLIFTCFR
jgi:hypothetical protein